MVGRSVGRCAVACAGEVEKPTEGRTAPSRQRRAAAAALQQPQRSKGDDVSPLSPNRKDRQLTAAPSNDVREECVIFGESVQTICSCIDNALGSAQNEQQPCTDRRHSCITPLACLCALVNNSIACADVIRWSKPIVSRTTAGWRARESSMTFLFLHRSATGHFDPSPTSVICRLSIFNHFGPYAGPIRKTEISG